MSVKVPSVFNKTQKVDDAVTMFVNGQVFQGWEDLQITRELNSASGDFQVQVLDKWRENQEPWRIQPGDKVELRVAVASVQSEDGNFTIHSGYVDKVSASVSSNSRRVTISGRSKTMDIVDCSVTGENEISNLNLKQISEKLLAPFGIRTVFKANPGAAFDKVTVQQGETVFALLDRLARQRKLIVYPTRFGNLAFDVRGSVRAGTTLKQGVNVISGSAEFDNTDRFSEYTTKGQNLSFLGNQSQNTSGQGKATDAGVTRFRPMVLVAETTADDATAADRASYEANIRAAKSQRVEIEVQGWFKENGNLWDLNELIPVDCGFLGVRKVMLCKKVVLMKNNAGTKATLTLVRKEAFEFKNEVPKEDNLGWLKGFNS